MKYFEKYLLDMIKSLKFRHFQGAFQTKIKLDNLKIRSTPNVFVFVHKSTKTNLYEIAANDYKPLLHENITKTCSPQNVWKML